MEAKDLRILFMGTPDFAVESLKTLVERGFNVVGVVTMPDKPSGRGLKMNQSAVKVYAEQVGLRVFQPEKLRDEAFLAELRALNIDLGIVIAFRMLPEVLWSMPRLGTFNLHASLLPQYRGAAPINWAIINGETKTGATTFMLNHEIDKGAVIARGEIDIEISDTAGIVHDKLMKMGAELVVFTIHAVIDEDVVILPQIESDDLKPAPKIFKEDCRINWSDKAINIHNFIRGLSPHPTAWSTMKWGSGERECCDVKIFSAMPIVAPSEASVAGSVRSDGKAHINVCCSDGYVSLTEIQLSGKKRMEIGEFLRGFKHIDTLEFV